MSRRLWVATLVACGAISACDRTSPQTPLPGSQTGEERISGNERLGWDQPANDRSAIASLRYSIYVDGIRSELTEVSCAATPSPAGFACSGRLPPLPPGSHTLELTAVATVGPVLESPRSSPFRVFVAPT